MDKKQTIKRELIGEVKSAGMNKTVVVLVNTIKMHPKYGKGFKVSKKYPIHDEKGEAKVGDKVKFVECRPISKTKRWRLTEVIK
jgi:small subunit ribosomal protein S17